ncbi:MAG: hypothetical protein AB2558_19040 [Candidatus Thiodiazotropha sp.]
MIIQLTYWQSICQQLINTSTAPRREKKNSKEEQQAFRRSLAKHSNRHYIRFS